MFGLLYIFLKISRESMPRIAGKLIINNHIQELRNQMKLTQQDLAEAIDVTRGTVIALEKGSYNPSLELAFRLADFFNVGIEKLFFKEGSGRE